MKSPFICEFFLKLNSLFNEFHNQGKIKCPETFSKSQQKSLKKNIQIAGPENNLAWDTLSRGFGFSTTWVWDTSPQRSGSFNWRQVHLNTSATAH